MAIGVRGAIASAVGLVWLVVMASSAAADGTLTGDVPGNDVPGGVALVGWSGGSIDELEVAAEQAECRLRSIWVTAGGDFVGYVVGAPAFANAEWTATVGTEVEARPLLIVCYTPGLGVCLVHGDVIDYAGETQGTESPWEALERGVLALSQFPDSTPPEGTFVEVSVFEATPEAAATSVFELVAHDGVVIGRFFVVDDGRGWLLSGTQVCHFPRAN